MDWKETVLTKSKTTEIILRKWSGFDPDFDIDYEVVRLIREAQAEISFKAGIITGTVEGKYDGRREVVEWFKNELGDQYPFDTQLLDDKLKEWGIENECS